LNKRRFVDVEEISEVIESPEAEQEAQLAADRAVTLVKNEGRLFPLANPSAACFWTLSESRYGMQGRRFAEGIRNRVSNARVQLFDPLVPLEEMEQMLENAATCETHVIAAFVTVGAYRGNVSLGGSYPAFLEKIQTKGKPIALISLGNPYLLKSFPDVGAYLATFSPVPTSEAAAVKAILGAIEITGRLPISIPGIAKYGESILLTRK